MSSCGVCYECERCFKCEKFGPTPMRQPVRRPPQPPPPVCTPQMPMTDEQRIRQIVLEILIELGLIPEARKRAGISPSK